MIHDCYHLTGIKILLKKKKKGYGASACSLQLQKGTCKAVALCCVHCANGNITTGSLGGVQSVKSNNSNTQNLSIHHVMCCE